MLLSWKRLGKDSFDAFRLRASMALSLSSSLTPRCSCHLWLIQAGFGRFLCDVWTIQTIWGGVIPKLLRPWGFQSRWCINIGYSHVTPVGFPLQWCDPSLSQNLASTRRWMPTSCSCAWPGWGGNPPLRSLLGSRRMGFSIEQKPLANDCWMALIF